MHTHFSLTNTALLHPDVEDDVEEDDAGDVNELVRRYIFGTDDRTAVGGARANFPYRVVGVVGNHCTGTLVGPRHVLTAGVFLDPAKYLVVCYCMHTVCV